MRNKLFLLIFLFFCIAGCAKPLHKDAEFTMGTYVEVVSSDPRACSIVFSEFRRLERIFNLFNETSELSRLNDRGTLAASPELFELVKKAKEYCELTDGALEVTIAPVSLLWKKAIKNKELPKEEEIKGLLSLVGCDSIYLDEKTSTITLLKPGAKIDLGSIAKGFAVGRAVRLLKDAGISSAVVNAGGKLYCLGKNNKRSWQVGIRDPRALEQVEGRFECEDLAVATSGDYEQFFLFKNKRYSHIINPKTGYPADSGIVSATVTAPDALTADALATALIVLGKDKGSVVIKRFPGTSAKLIDEDGTIHDL